jgi:Fe-S-cluster-containing hydrogenase component 2
MMVLFAKSKMKDNNNSKIVKACPNNVLEIVENKKFADSLAECSSRPFGGLQMSSRHKYYDSYSYCKIPEETASP